MKMGMTPILEFISPDNRIVLRYTEPKLVLTAMRDTVNGTYLPIDDLEELPHLGFPFEVVENLGTVRNLTEHLATTRASLDREGDVIRWADGHMVKVKGEYYSLIHHTKEQVQKPRLVVAMILNKKLDDAKSLLEGPDRAAVDSMEKEFWDAVQHCADRLLGLFIRARADYDANPKRIALEMKATIPVQEDVGLLFTLLRGGDISETILAKCRTHLSADIRHDECMKWMLK